MRQASPCVRKIAKLNTKNPSARGGGQKFRISLSSGPAAPSRKEFFLVRASETFGPIVEMLNRHESPRRIADLKAFPQKCPDPLRAANRPDPALAPGLRLGHGGFGGRGDRIIAGHGRVAAKREGMAEVPVMVFGCNPS